MRLIFLGFSKNLLATKFFFPPDRIPRTIDEQIVDDLSLRKLTMSLQNWFNQQCKCIDTCTCRWGSMAAVTCVNVTWDSISQMCRHCDKCQEGTDCRRKWLFRLFSLLVCFRFFEPGLHRASWQPPGHSEAALLTLWCPGCRKKGSTRENHACTIRCLFFSIFFLRGLQPRDTSAQWVMGMRATPMSMLYESNHLSL